MKYLVLMESSYRYRILKIAIFVMDAILMNPSISALTHITVQALATGRSVAMART